jgi:hypothetical protein
VDPKRRIVTQLPLRGLWQDSGPISAWRSRQLSSSELRDLLRDGPVQFVVADVGVKLRWIDLEDCYRFWMNEVKHHLAEPEEQINSNVMSELYFYAASEWESQEPNSPIVVLERRVSQVTSALGKARIPSSI